MKIEINQKLLIVILLLIIMLLAGYIGFDKYNGYVIGTMRNAYNSGYRDGVTAAVQQIIKQSESCNPVPIYFGNVTKNLIDIDCLLVNNFTNNLIRKT